MKTIELRQKLINSYNQLNSNNNKLHSTIKFEVGTFILVNDDYEDGFVTISEFRYDEDYCDELEVIGNIYENPGLLEK